jgi:hypothetical protein
MGLLDDAIREHLELKRRRGADPGEVAQQERAALDPQFGEVAPAEVTDPEAPVVDPGLAEWEAHGAGAGEAAGWGDVPRPAGPETAELDMEAVLESDVHEGHQGDPLAHEALHAAGPGTPAGGGDPLDWEMPGDGHGEVPQEIPGQERLSFE